MNDTELEALAGKLIRKLESPIRELIQEILEDSTCTLLQHLAHELDVFAKMKKNKQI